MTIEERYCPECGREAEFVRPVSVWRKEGVISRYWHVSDSECDVIAWDDYAHTYRHRDDLPENSRTINFLIAQHEQAINAMRANVAEFYADN